MLFLPPLCFVVVSVLLLGVRPLLSAASGETAAVIRPIPKNFFLCPSCRSCLLPEPPFTRKAWLPLSKCLHSQSPTPVDDGAVIDVSVHQLAWFDQSLNRPGDQHAKRGKLTITRLIPLLRTVAKHHAYVRKKSDHPSRKRQVKTMSSGILHKYA